jgi:hypothetical protein
MYEALIDWMNFSLDISYYFASNLNTISAIPETSHENRFHKAKKRPDKSDLLGRAEF